MPQEITIDSFGPSEPGGNKIKTCACGACFYCFINQNHFHTSNFGKLKAPQLVINVAEYVGAETVTCYQTDKK